MKRLLAMSALLIIFSLQFSSLTLLAQDDSLYSFEVDEFKFRNKGLLVHFKGVDDRDAAAGYVHADIAIERAQLPELEVGEFYWHQLIGLTVISEFDGDSIRSIWNSRDY